jgi:hypothetical protein
MEMKVKLLDGAEEKGVAQLEEELLAKHEESLSTDNNFEPQEQEQEQEQEQKQEQEQEQEQEFEPEDELSEERVLSYIGKRYNKEINSFDELMAERNITEEIPSDVAAYMKYKKDTGRGFEDFIKLNKDFDAMDPEDLVKEYLQSINTELDSDDIESLLEDYQYDEDLDDDAFIKKTKIARKKIIAEAKNTSIIKRSNTIHLSSRLVLMFPMMKKKILKHISNIPRKQRLLMNQTSVSVNGSTKKTNEVLNDDFKGFDFNINDKKLSFSPGNLSEIKKNHSSPQNFINKFLDENGLMKDAQGYHKSLAMAMNPDKFAKFFYEQGQADATENVTSKIKNINMSERKVSEASNRVDGMQVKSLSPESGSGLKIRSIKRI